MSTNLKIAIVEPSVIVRIGLEGLLRRLPGFHVQIVEIAEEAVMGSLRMHKPDVLLVNPVDGGDFMSRHWKEECGCPDLKCVALLYALFDERILRHYDERISVYDSMDEVKRKLERLVAEDIPDEEMDEQIALYMEHLQTAEEKDRAYIIDKVNAVREKLSGIDDMINEAVEGWSTERMMKVDLTVIRLAVYEMKYDENIPVGVAINEAVELAKRYGTDQSPSFVNGVLAKLA